VVPRVPRLLRPWLRDMLQLRALPQAGGCCCQLLLKHTVMAVIDRPTSYTHLL
jgi:hypothetical protein